MFNRVGPMVDAVAGAEVNNRQQIQYIPRRVGDKGINEVLTGAADYIRDNCDAEDEESDAFVDAVICGVGVTETRLSYDDNPEGEILIERRDPLSMRWDPSAKKRNLMDRRWHQYDAWLTREEIEEKWPDADITPTNDFGSNDDESIHDQSLAWLYERDATGYDKSTGKSRVIHHQWWEMEKFYQVLDEATGQIIEVEEDQFETLNERAQKVGLPIQSVRRPASVTSKRLSVAGRFWKSQTARATGSRSTSSRRRGTAIRAFGTGSSARCSIPSVGPTSSSVSCCTSSTPTPRAA